MLFNSIAFLYYFLPIVLLVYYLLPKRFCNSFLALASLLFFSWGGIKYVSLLLLSTFLNYIFGLLAEDNLKNRKLWLVLGVLANLTILIYFKYSGFLVENYNTIVAQPLGWKYIDFHKVILPIGISFYTFHGMSYQIDVYRGQTKAQRSFLCLLLYKTFFPQLIAGPIVRYNHISGQLTNRKINRDSIEKGLQRFIIGLGKKVIIADTFAHVSDTLWSLELNQMSTGTAWIALVAYALQIYIDFSAYSDMAIGLARMFGFKFPENFDFPYLSKSFKEFWQRWHISLSTWFRDYLYFPLGGNRHSFLRTFFNLWVVFLCTGFWHGASWNFILWGGLHGFFLSLEKLKLTSFIRLPGVLRQTRTFILVLLTWVPFRANDINHTYGIYKKLFGAGSLPVDTYYEYLHASVLTRDFFLVLLLSIFFSFGGLQWLKSRKWMKFTPLQFVVLNTVKSVGLIAVFLLCTSYIIAGSYSPFIYFRF